jgi:hypothetical protein
MKDCSKGYKLGEENRKYGKQSEGRGEKHTIKQDSPLFPSSKN